MASLDGQGIRASLRLDRHRASGAIGAARDLQRRGELAAALNCASEAARLFPCDAEYCSVLDEILLEAPDPFSLVPIHLRRLDLVSAPIRARVLMIRGKVVQASNLIARVVLAAPELGYLVWVRDWLRPTILRTLPRPNLNHLINDLGRLGLALPAHLCADDPRLPNLVAAVDILHSVRTVFVHEPFVVFLEDLLRRRLIPEQHW